jgi:hypothetical protein
MHYIRQELETSDPLLLIYHPDLRGGLIEQGIAYALGLPIWLAHPAGLKISTTARECATHIIAYTTPETFIAQLHRAFESCKETP